jgi:hypothetical protein
VKNREFRKPLVCYGFVERIKDLGILSTCAYCKFEFGGCKEPQYNAVGLTHFYCAQLKDFKFKRMFKDSPMDRED